MQNFRHEESALDSVDKREKRSLETALRREALQRLRAGRTIQPEFTAAAAGKVQTAKGDDGRKEKLKRDFAAAAKGKEETEKSGGAGKGSEAAAAFSICFSFCTEASNICTSKSLFVLPLPFQHPSRRVVERWPCVGSTATWAVSVPPENVSLSTTAVGMTFELNLLLLLRAVPRRSLVGDCFEVEGQADTLRADLGQATSPEQTALSHSCRGARNRPQWASQINQPLMSCLKITANRRKRYKLRFRVKITALLL